MQAAKTYLEKNFQTFEVIWYVHSIRDVALISYLLQDADLNTLVKHALTALKESSQNGEINSKNASISIVGVCRFRILGI